jgi:hypothetical protein
VSECIRRRRVKVVVVLSVAGEVEVTEDEPLKYLTL